MSKANEREWTLSDNISGTSDSEGYWSYPQYPILLAQKGSPANTFGSVGQKIRHKIENRDITL